MNSNTTPATRSLLGRLSAVLVALAAVVGLGALAPAEAATGTTTARAAPLPGVVTKLPRAA